jgi:hypothetical protein
MALASSANPRNRSISAWPNARPGLSEATPSTPTTSPPRTSGTHTIAGIPSGPRSSRGWPGPVLVRSPTASGVPVRHTSPASPSPLRRLWPTLAENRPVPHRTTSCWSSPSTSQSSASWAPTSRAAQAATNAGKSPSSCHPARSGSIADEGSGASPAHPNQVSPLETGTLPPGRPLTTHRRPADRAVAPSTVSARNLHTVLREARSSDPYMYDHPPRRASLRTVERVEVGCGLSPVTPRRACRSTAMMG